MFHVVMEWMKVIFNMQPLKILNKINGFIIFFVDQLRTFEDE